MEDQLHEPDEYRTSKVLLLVDLGSFVVSAAMPRSNARYDDSSLQLCVRSLLPLDKGAGGIYRQRQQHSSKRICEELKTRSESLRR